MKEDYSPFTVDVPADFEPRFAAVFRPVPVIVGDRDYPAKYGFTFPSELLPDGMEEWLGYHSGYHKQHFKPLSRGRGTGEKTIRATSRVEPTVIPGYGSAIELNLWQSLLWLCDNTNMPRDFVFRERTVRLLVQPFEYDTGSIYGIGLVLRAVQVSELSEGFLRRYLQERLELMKELETE